MKLPEATLPASHKQWVVQQLLSGKSAMVLVKQLLADGFTFEAIVKALGNNLPKGLTYDKDISFYQKLARPKFIGQAGVVDHSNENVQLFSVPDFLDGPECKLVIDYALTDLKPSTISGGDRLSGHRTSSSSDLSFMDRPELLAIEKKIVSFMGLGIGEKEVMQAQHYAIGQEFKKHTDYYVPGAKEYKEDARHRGQRTWTFMLYLNDGCAGGETEFLKLGIKFKPTRGLAVIWNNLYPNGIPNPYTLHRSIPIESGEKIIITKWFRNFN